MLDMYGMMTAIATVAAIATVEYRSQKVPLIEYLDNGAGDQHKDHSNADAL